jgi:hypothetical protein
MPKQVKNVLYYQSTIIFFKLVAKIFLERILKSYIFLLINRYIN